MLVVEVSGEVDLSTAPRLGEALLQAQRTGNEVVVDLERVEFMDCVGLRAPLDATDRASAGAPAVSVTPGQPQVQKLFALSGVGRLLHMVPRPAIGHAPALA